jgi:hypothetical protein
MIGVWCVITARQIIRAKYFDVNTSIRNGH